MGDLVGYSGSHMHEIRPGYFFTKSLTQRNPHGIFSFERVSLSEFSFGPASVVCVCEGLDLRP